MNGRSFANRPDREDGNERWLYGDHVVREWVRSRPECVQVVLRDRDISLSPSIRSVLRHAADGNIRVEVVSAKQLAEFAGTRRHQGLVARCYPFPYVDLAELSDSGGSPLVIVDQLQDPQNLGAILRSCDAVRSAGVILPKDSSVGVTPAVEAAAAGAAALVRVCRVTNLVRTIDALKEAGYWVVALDAHSPQSIFEADLPTRLALILGGETGLRKLVVQSSDFQVSIPMYGRVESLNASVAAAVALYEVRRRYEGARPAPDAQSGS